MPVHLQGFRKSGRSILSPLPCSILHRTGGVAACRIFAITGRIAGDLGQTACAPQPARRAAADAGTVAGGSEVARRHAQSRAGMARLWQPPDEPRTEKAGHESEPEAVAALDAGRQSAVRSQTEVRGYD